MKSDDARKQYSLSKREYSKSLKTTKYGSFGNIIECSNNEMKVCGIYLRLNDAVSEIILRIDEDVISEQSAVAEAFEYFTEINVHSANDHVGGNLSATCKIQHYFFFFPVVDQKAASVIKNPKNKKSSDQAMISVKVIKRLAPYVSENLAHVNLSVTSRRFFCHTQYGRKGHSS